jgi:hypothetical protein
MTVSRGTIPCPNIRKQNNIDAIFGGATETKMRLEEYIRVLVQ